MGKAELRKILDWANKELAVGAEPPSIRPEYVTLRDSLQAIIAHIDDTVPRLEDLLDIDRYPVVHPPVVSNPEPHAAAGAHSRPTA